VRPRGPGGILEDDFLVRLINPDARVAHRHSTIPTATVALSSTRASGVNFSAFDRRFSRICVTLRLSAVTAPTRRSTSSDSPTP